MLGGKQQFLVITQLISHLHDALFETDNIVYIPFSTHVENFNPIRRKSFKMNPKSSLTQTIRKRRRSVD